jgi:hypothetical protein
MFKSILKTFFMLFRNAIMFGLAFAWLFKDIAGAGHLLGAYIVFLAVLMLVALCFPVKPEKALNVKLGGKLFRWTEIAFQYVLLLVLIWFAHFWLATAWTVACLGLSVMRKRFKAAREAALQAQAEHIMEAFKAYMTAAPVSVNPGSNGAESALSVGT